MRQEWRQNFNQLSSVYVSSDKIATNYVFHLNEKSNVSKKKQHIHKKTAHLKAKKIFRPRYSASQWKVWCMSRLHNRNGPPRRFRCPAGQRKHGPWIVWMTRDFYCLARMVLGMSSHVVQYCRFSRTQGQNLKVSRALSCVGGRNNFHSNRRGPFHDRGEQTNNQTFDLRRRRCSSDRRLLGR